MYVEGVNGFATLAPRPANLHTIPTAVLRDMQARANERLLFGGFTGESKAILKAHRKDLAEELARR